MTTKAEWGITAVNVLCAAMALAVLVSFAPMPSAHAAPTAQQVLDSVEDSGLLTGSGRAVIEMTVEKGKQKKMHRLEVFRVDDGKGTSKQMVEFQAPADVRHEVPQHHATGRRGSDVAIFARGGPRAEDSRQRRAGAVHGD